MGKVNWNDIFYYSEDSPTGLRWKSTRRNPRFNNITALKDEVAGCLRFYKNGLPRNSAVSVNNKSYYIHRIIYEMLTGCKIEKGCVIDHVDGNPHNNRIDNLKKVLSADNSHNVKKMSHNKSGITGVVYCQSTNSWRAVWHDGQGKQKSKSYSVNKFGSAAKQMAINQRKIAIEQLRQNGYLYTERHGT